MSTNKKYQLKQVINKIYNQEEGNKKPITQIQQLQQLLNIYHQNNQAQEENDVFKKNQYDDVILNDNLSHLFAIVHNDDYNVHRQYPDVYLANQNIMDQNTNSNHTLLHPLWNHNYYLDNQDQDLRKDQIFNDERIDNRNLVIRNKQQIEEQISHYINQIDDNANQHKMNQANQKTQVKHNSHQKVKSIRREKVIKYLQKKQKRCYYKKITYECRKVVADKRIRLKGRFINVNQAISELGLDSNRNYDIQQLKQLIKKKLQSSI